MATHLTPQRRAALEEEIRRLIDQLRARLSDPRRAGLSHVDFMRLSNGGRSRLPESAGLMTEPRTGDASDHSDGFPLSSDDVFAVNVARAVIYAKADDLISELAGGGELTSIFEGSLLERARLNCLEIESVKSLFQRFPQTIETAIRLSVLRFRHIAQSATPFARTPLARMADADHRQIAKEVDEAFRKSVQKNRQSQDEKPARRQAQELMLTEEIPSKTRAKRVADQAVQMLTNRQFRTNLAAEPSDRRPPSATASTKAPRVSPAVLQQMDRKMDSAFAPKRNEARNGVPIVSDSDHQEIQDEMNRAFTRNVAAAKPTGMPRGR